MNRSTRICLLAILCAVLVLGILASAYYFYFYKTGFRSGSKTAEENDHFSSEELAYETPNDNTSSVMAEPYRYILREEEGYVIVYASDGQTVFEITDIALETLSEELRAQIIQGKPIYSEQELYDFLENHSS